MCWCSTRSPYMFTAISLLFCAHFIMNVCTNKRSKGLLTSCHNSVSASRFRFPRIVKTGSFIVCVCVHVYKLKSIKRDAHMCMSADIPLNHLSLCSRPLLYVCNKIVTLYRRHQQHYTLYIG